LLVSAHHEQHHQRTDGHQREGHHGIERHSEHAYCNDRCHWGQAAKQHQQHVPVRAVRTWTHVVLGINVHVSFHPYASLW